LKDLTTALVGNKIAVVDGIIGRCVGGIEVVLRIGGASESEQEANEDDNVLPHNCGLIDICAG